MSLPTPTPLTPDDDQVKVTLFADRRPAAVTSIVVEPYALAAVLIALLALLLLRATRHAVLTDLLVAALLGAMSYRSMLHTHLTCSTRLLCMAAAGLGLLYGLPAALLYMQEWHWQIGLILAGGLVLAAFNGMLLSLTEAAEESPRNAIAVSFLAFFVMGNLLTLWLGLSGG
jgi:hypothetical protein